MFSCETVSLATPGLRTIDNGTHTLDLKLLSKVFRWLQKDPWSAWSSVLDLGFIHQCFPWLPGGGRWGRMALHRHSGAPATHVPRLLADGVGAGSERDRHGHCRGGKGHGHPPSVPGGGRGAGARDGPQTSRFPGPEAGIFCERGSAEREAVASSQSLRLHKPPPRSVLLASGRGSCPGEGPRVLEPLFCCPSPGGKRPQRCPF